MSCLIVYCSYSFFLKAGSTVHCICVFFPSPKPWSKPWPKTLQKIWSKLCLAKYSSDKLTENYSENNEKNLWKTSPKLLPKKRKLQFQSEMLPFRWPERFHLSTKSPGWQAGYKFSIRWRHMIRKPRIRSPDTQKARKNWKSIEHHRFSFEKKQHVNKISGKSKDSRTKNMNFLSYVSTLGNNGLALSLESTISVFALYFSRSRFGIITPLGEGVGSFWSNFRSDATKVPDENYMSRKLYHVEQAEVSVCMHALAICLQHLSGDLVIYIYIMCV